MIPLYDDVSYELSYRLARRYSTSFSTSMWLFPGHIRRPVAAIYGLVRIADEIVDTYDGPDQAAQLDALEVAVTQAITRGYDTNPIVHAYALVTKQYDIPLDYTRAFFESMREDITPRPFDKAMYERYIYGSAEVVGLMCLKIFVTDPAEFRRLETGARALGSAYQKVNFLRDIKADAETLGRWYFPYGSFESFDDTVKQRIIRDIRRDFATGKKAWRKLPAEARRSVGLSILYYEALLRRLERTPATKLKQRRIRVGGLLKTLLFVRAWLGWYGR